MVKKHVLVVNFSLASTVVCGYCTWLSSKSHLTSEPFLEKFNYCVGDLEVMCYKWIQNV